VDVVMMETTLTLGFSCCTCEQPVSVTVQCKGQGPQGPGGAVAAVNVPCPTCGQVNQLSFEPTGQVRSVRPCLCFRSLVEPSAN
jgi:hypothetical protein